MKKNFIFTLITVLAVASLVHTNPNKQQTLVRKNARNLKFQQTDNPGQIGYGQRFVYYGNPKKAVSNK